jgi:phosphoribosylanthranilate isomerase
MKIKICGITNKEDALNAVALDVDAIGFIFYEHSPRYVTPEVVEEIMLDLPPFIHTVGVFVNSSFDYIEQIRKRCKLNVCQLHGSETPDFCLPFKSQLIKAISVKDTEDLAVIPKYKGVVSSILLDTKVENVHGGTGKTFDWGLALEAKEYDVPLILSGGINEDNIEKAITMVQPYAIDLCSGVENEPGKKDYNKMKHLIDIFHSVS